VFDTLQQFQGLFIEVNAFIFRRVRFAIGRITKAKTNVLERSKYGRCVHDRRHQARILGRSAARSALPTESAPTNIAKYIDGKRRAMTQPVMEATAFSSNVEFGLPQENDLFE
jgi:hypothetical protein